MTDNTPTDPAAPGRTRSAKTPAAKTPAAKTPTAKSSVAKAPAARKSTTPTVTPVEAIPAVSTPASTLSPASVVPAGAATAPAGWYTVAAGSSQQRWWDGAVWTEHFYDPAAVAAPAAVPGVRLRAPEGVKPDTVWFWLLAVGAPVLQLLNLIPLSIYLGQLLGGDPTNPSAMVAAELSPAYLIVALSGWFIFAACIVFAALDWRELKARGVPKPFHWAWSFFVVLVGWPGVYVIGRTIIAKRRTGAGTAPLWVYIGLQLVAFVVIFVVVIIALVQFFGLLGDSFAAAGNVL